MDHDTDLWARLNALKPKSQIEPSTVLELQARLQALRGEKRNEENEDERKFQSEMAKLATEGESAEQTDVHDEDIDKLWGDIEGSGDFITEEDLKEAQDLLQEAKQTLKDIPDETEHDGETEMEKDEVDAKSDAGESESAAEYIEQVLADLAIDEDVSEKDEQHASEDQEDKEQEHQSKLVEPEGTNKESHDEHDILNLPSTPQGIRIQSPPQDREDGDAALETRLASLMGGKRSQTSTPVVRKEEPEDDSDDWCIICYDDATVKCYGCDGDLYCTKCWKEGHTGPDAGLEERSHRAAAFKKSGKKKKLSAMAA